MIINLYKNGDAYQNKLIGVYGELCDTDVEIKTSAVPKFSFLETVFNVNLRQVFYFYGKKLQQLILYINLFCSTNFMNQQVQYK